MNQRLDALRAKMNALGMDLYIVPTDDFHLSEYVGDYFKCREYLTGFTGSAGIAVVTKEEAGLWTDGRYFLQAEEQLRDSGFTLYKMGMPGVPRITEFVLDKLPEGGVLGYDGRVISASMGKALDEIIAKKGASISSERDLVGEIWTDRPALSCEKAWILDEPFAGESAQSKIARIREKMKEYKTPIHVMAALDDIMWTLNLRGNDVTHCPVVLSFLMISEEECTFFVQDGAMTDEVAEYLAGFGVDTEDYENVYSYAEALSEIGGLRVLISGETLNDRLYRLLKKGCEVVDKANPAMLFKAVKNETELNNIKDAHLIDGIVMTKWLYWFKQNVGRTPMTECDAAKKLDDMRRAVDSAIDISFDTIAGYGPNGAIVHYEPVPGQDRQIEPKGFLLVDSGGHYLEGSTDITRTVACGPLTEKEKAYFTLVLKGHLNLANARFLSGCTGVSLDYLAREPLWTRDLDYRHGTGHGIGYLLNVHEGPNGFRYRVVPERIDSETFVPGMVTTDEPGVYVENEFGVRTESILVCREGEKNEYGQFLYFENITLCPIDLSAVKADLLSEKEREELNSYHEKVYRELSPYMTDEENTWLREETRRI